MALPPQFMKAKKPANKGMPPAMLAAMQRKVAKGGKKPYSPAEEKAESPAERLAEAKAGVK